jgi:hypothetical protein
MAKPSTRQHYHSSPDFTVLGALHEKLHAQAQQLVNQVQTNERATVAEKFLALDALSDKVLSRLRMLRQTDATPQWSDTSSAPL